MVALWVEDGFDFGIQRRRNDAPTSMSQHLRSGSDDDRNGHHSTSSNLTAITLKPTRNEERDEED